MLHDVTVFVWLFNLILGSELDLSAPRSKSNVETYKEGASSCRQTSHGKEPECLLSLIQGDHSLGLNQFSNICNMNYTQWLFLN